MVWACWLTRTLPLASAAAYLEFPWDPPGWTEQRRDFFLAEPVTIGQDGLPSGPASSGLGAEINEEAKAARLGDRAQEHGPGADGH